MEPHGYWYSTPHCRISARVLGPMWVSLPTIFSAFVLSQVAFLLLEPRGSYWGGDVVFRVAWSSVGGARENEVALGGFRGFVVATSFWLLLRCEEITPS
ncbi:hypothetical protein V6N12_047588 [Hibiscus sabdariffa]|uniref:Uncharacterized protein n=1 Tax=Hibiscus sabdariffa TaxID=183260 RepID=A0ABR1ZZ13_9ROSI